MLGYKGTVNCLNVSRSILVRFGMHRPFHWGIVLGKKEYRLVFMEVSHALSRYNTNIKHGSIAENCFTFELLEIHSARWNINIKIWYVYSLALTQSQITLQYVCVTPLWKSTCLCYSMLRRWCLGPTPSGHDKQNH